MPPRPKKPAPPGAGTGRLEAFGLPRPTASPRVVKVGGVTGIFTPVTNEPDTPLSDDERQNLQWLIEQSSKHVAELEADNLALSQQLDELRNPPRAPEEFATAIQHSIDELQQKLTTMRNPVSNFGLKAFRVEAKVMVDVSRLGSIEYRFIRPGEKADPNAVSQLTLDLVPLPKAGPERSWTSELFQPGLGIEALPEITTAQAKTLAANQIFTVGEFLQVGTRARASAQLVALLGIERKALAGWLKQAEILTLKGMNGATAEVLIAAGFSSLEAIARATPDALLSDYLAKRKELGSNKAVAAKLEDATRWVHASRRYAGVKD